MKPQVKKTLNHIAAIVIMLVIACIYFSPVLSGDIVIQGDMQKAEAMSHAQNMTADSTGTIPNWNPAMFSGMPGYQTVTEPQKSVFTTLKSIFTLRPLGVHRNIGMLWLYLIGFYVAMIAIGCSPWLSLLGALAFGLGSYNIIIVEAGHITKGWAIAMIAPMLAGMVLAIKSVNDDKKINWKRLIWGFILFTIATGLQITFNHIQITYYTVIGGVVLGLTYMVYALKDKWFKPFLIVIGVLLVGCAFAVGGNYRHLSVNQEYAKATMRGGSEITVTPHNIGLDSDKNAEATQTGGLDINYAFSWSYGIGETYTLLVPGAMGGGSGERVSEDSDWYRSTRQKQAPLYWGDQPFTSGPVYFGAIVFFLFVLGCFIVRGPERWWLIIATVIAIVMSWGRHFLPLNEFLFNHLPLYNKFRTPSMSLVLANTCMVIMATLSVKTIFESIVDKGTKNQVADYDSQKRMNKALYWSAGIVGGIIIIGVILAKTTLTFSGPGDNQYQNMLGNRWLEFQRMLINERQSLFMHDSWRSFIFVVLTFGILWLYINKIIKKNNIVIALLAIFIVIDLWGVDRRYLNKDNFTEPRKLELRRTPTEAMLDQIATANGDRDYRVYDLTVNTFNDSRPSAFHNEIGGYSAAKLRRYQDLIDFYLGSQKLFNHINSCQIGIIGNDGSYPLLAVQESYPVLDMLNARYFMLNLQNNQPTPVRRSTALGNCWIVEEIEMVDNANAEILALNDFDPYKTAIVDKSQWQKELDGFITTLRDSSDYIILTHSYPQTPDHLYYKSHTSKERIAVFSEIFYAPDWQAYIDGKPVNHFRTDYVLRALRIPAGDHTIEFVNEAPTLHRNDMITLIISVLMLLVMAGAVFVVYNRKKNK